MPTSSPLRFAFAVLLLLASTAHAQLFRAYLSSTGNDANPCTVQAPCRLLPAALAAVKDGGEIWMVDSANFNTATVNIAKSVSILAAPGVIGSIVGSNGDAILIDAPGARVSLRNLKILNFQNGQFGIRMANGAALKVEGCEVAGFTAQDVAGIYVKTPADITIVDTTVRDSNNGIWFDGGARGTVHRSTVVGNAFVGVLAYPTINSGVTVTVAVTDTVSSHNRWGFRASSVDAARPALMIVSRSTASHNNVAPDSAGFEAFGVAATMIVSASVATRNRTGLSMFGAGFGSLGDNTVFSNVSADTLGTISLITPR